MKKKGVEMSLNVIIIAAIGLLILVILAFLVINAINNTNKGLESCTVKGGGRCQATCENGFVDPLPSGKPWDCQDKPSTPNCCKIL